MKFLTVLLVIAVMFTFSFGSAFAATDSEKATALTKAKAVAEKIVADYFDEAMVTVVGDNLGYTAADSNAIAAAWAKIDAKADVLAKINELYIAESKLISDGIADNDNYDENVNKYAAKVFKLDATSAGYAAALSYTNASGTAVLPVTQLANFIRNLDGLQAVLNMYNADREDALSAFDKVNWSLYSTDVCASDADGRTYLKIAEDKIAKAKEDAAEKEVYKLSEMDWSFPAWLVGRLNAKVKEEFVNTIVEAETITVSGTAYPTGLYKVVGVPTKTAVDADKAVDAAAIAANKAAAANAYAQFIKDRGTTYKTFADAWLKVVNFLAEEGMLTTAPVYDGTTYGTLLNGAGAPIDPGDTSYNAAVNTITNLEAFAEKYKGEKDATGALVRDADDVDDIVEEYTAYLYGTTHGVSTADVDTYLTLNDAETAIIACSIDSDAQALAFAKEQYKTKLADDLDDLAVEYCYYELEAAKVQANYEAGVAKIEAATSPAKVAAAYAAINLTKDAKSMSQVDALCTYAPSSPEKAALDAVEAYVTYANSGKTILNADYIIWNSDDAKDAIEEVYGKAGARTATARKAVTVDAAAVAAELSTVGALDAAKKAAEDAIKALPATITAADQDAVVAAWELAEDYADMTGAGTLDSIVAAKLNNAETALLNALRVDFAKKISAADKTDKAALRALQDEIDAVNKLFEDDEIFDGETTIDNAKVIDKAIKAIREKELTAVKATINALPVNITEANKAQVEAARKAYDTFVEDWTDYREPYNAAAKVDNFRTLALAEAALGLNAEDPALSVEALKITASSTAAKGSITVKWTVKGDTSAVEGWEIWKSTKRNSGFSKAYTQVASKQTYKNTKGLKKGTRYYYKVRAIAYDADGTKIKSDWSNKAYRIAK